jgi:hypothetical protein
MNRAGVPPTESCPKTGGKCLPEFGARARSEEVPLLARYPRRLGLLAAPSERSYPSRGCSERGRGARAGLAQSARTARRDAGARLGTPSPSVGRPTRRARRAARPDARPAAAACRASRPGPPSWSAQSSQPQFRRHRPPSGRPAGGRSISRGAKKECPHCLLRLAGIGHQVASGTEDSVRPPVRRPGIVRAEGAILTPWAPSCASSPIASHPACACRARLPCGTRGEFRKAFPASFGT